MLNKKSKKTILKSAIFGGVFSAMMSVSFLVQAKIETPATDEQKKTSVMTEETTEVTVVPQNAEGFFEQKGIATWYGPQFHGRRTASGERYDMHAYTAAHKTLPFGTIVKVTNAETGESVLVEVTDRGPFVHNRIIDLSYTASREVGVTNHAVELEAFNPGRFAAANTGRTLAFNSDCDAVALEENSFDVIETEGDFSDAVRKLKMFQAQSDDEVYLIVSPAQTVRTASSKKTGSAVYSLAVLKQKESQRATITRVAYN